MIKTALIVDANKIWLDSAAKRLQNYLIKISNDDEVKWRILSAQTPADALAIIDEQPINVIVTNILFQYNNVMDLLNELISYDDTLIIPKILLSNQETAIDIGDFQIYGVVAKFDKASFQMDELAQKIIEVAL